MHEKITLPNGVRIITEAVPQVRSAALGIYVAAGSRQEREEENGAAHFIEHMLFKGTAGRSAAALAEEMDAVGGQVNAYTTKESTCFYARTLDSHLDRAGDILCDMFFCSKFDEADVRTERGVILEEIGMYEDNPEDLTAERLSAAVYEGSALARPILGRRETLEKMTGAWLKGYMAEHYLAGDIVVALAGSFKERQVEELKGRFSGLPKASLPPIVPAQYRPAVTVKEKPIEQNHLTLAFPGLPYADERRYALQILTSVLGGGMSSRLWQRVREEKGLCYSVYAYGAGHADTGLFAIYTALGKETEGEALGTVIDTVRAFRDEGISQMELERAREQSKANVILGLESTQARMANLGRSELITGRVKEIDDIIAAYDAVTRDQVRALAEEIFDFSRASLSAVGQVSLPEEYKKILEEAK